LACGRAPLSALDDAYLKQIVAAFGISRDRVLAHQWVDNGPGWAVLRLPTADEVLALEPDLSLIPTAMVGAIGAYPHGSRHDFEMRTFAPRCGVAEDPACGSMNAAVGQWLTSTGAAPSRPPGLPGGQAGTGRDHRDHHRHGRHRLGEWCHDRLHPRHHRRVSTRLRDSIP
jgi:predicted PhzF superfamily epimerase YddE/YHI9